MNDHNDYLTNNKAQHVFCIPHIIKHFTYYLKDKLFQEPTYIHIQTTCFRLTMWERQMFFSLRVFTSRLHSVVTKKGPISLLLILRGNIIRKLKGITNLNVKIGKKELAPFSFFLSLIFFYYCFPERLSM